MTGASSSRVLQVTAIIAAVIVYCPVQLPASPPGPALGAAVRDGEIGLVIVDGTVNAPRPSAVDVSGRFRSIDSQFAALESWALFFGGDTSANTYLWGNYNGSASFLELRNWLATENQRSVVFMISVQGQRRRLQNPRIRGEWASFLRDHPTVLLNDLGQRFIGEETLGARVMIRYRFHTTRFTGSRFISALAQTGGDWLSIFSADLSASFFLTAQRAAANRAVNVTIDARGVPPEILARLGRAATSGRQDMMRVISELAEFIADPPDDYERKVVDYSTFRLSDLPEVKEALVSSGWTDSAVRARQQFVDQALSNLAARSGEVREKLADLYDTIEHAEQWGSNPEVLARLRGWANRFEAADARIVRRLIECSAVPLNEDIDDGTCSTGGLVDDLPIVELPRREATVDLNGFQLEALSPTGGRVETAGTRIDLVARKEIAPGVYVRSRFPTGGVFQSVSADRRTPGLRIEAIVGQCRVPAGRVRNVTSASGDTLELGLGEFDRIRAVLSEDGALLTVYVYAEDGMALECGEDAQFTFRASAPLRVAREIVVRKDVPTDEPIEVANAIGELRWDPVDSSELPPGLRMRSSSGGGRQTRVLGISGTATEVGEWVVHLGASDETGERLDAELTISVVESHSAPDPRAPSPFPNGDVNGDGVLSLADAVYELNHLFMQGPPPVVVWAYSKEHADAIGCWSN